MCSEGLPTKPRTAFQLHQLMASCSLLRRQSRRTLCGTSVGLSNWTRRVDVSLHFPARPTAHSCIHFRMHSTNHKPEDKRADLSPEPHSHSHSHSHSVFHSHAGDESHGADSLVSILQGKGRIDFSYYSTPLEFIRRCR